MTTLPATRQTHSPASRPDAGRPAIGLTIAGSDSGGGAGIQADLKAFSALGVYGASVITALTAQNTRTVTAVHEVPTEIVAAQIAAVFDDLPVDAVKVGMLSSPQVIRCVAKGLANLSIPTVLDPVMIAKSGDALLQDAAVETLRTELLPLAALLTPNLPEAARLLETVPARTEPEMEAQGCKLLELGPAAVLMKGGHADGAVCVDILVSQGAAPLRFEAERVDTRNTHGTGCTLSSAIAAGLAKALPIDQAVSEAHTYLQGAILASAHQRIGNGHGPVHHFHRFWG